MSWLIVALEESMQGVLSYYLKYIVPFANSSTDPVLFSLTVTLTLGVRTWKFISLIDEVRSIYQPSFTEIRWTISRGANQKVNFYGEGQNDASEGDLWQHGKWFIVLNVLIINDKYRIRRDKHCATDLILWYTFHIKYMPLISHNVYKDKVQHGTDYKECILC